MPGVERTTRQRILLAARDLLVSRGLRRVSMEEVADAAGITRMTVYRHFGDRESLVREASLQLAEALEAVVTDLGHQPRPDVDAFLGRIGEVVMALPVGLQTAMEELEKSYPEVHAEVRGRERAAIGLLFDLLYSGAEAQGRLRPGLKRQVVEMLFWEVVTGFFDYPALQAQGLSPAEVFHTIVDVLLNGMLVEAASPG
ncbi:MAG: TetR/AcrR family transcriptional regulator [Acidimicrobiia bacterium]|nr:TetR/AcrR family transcriptional regulator [Acidimicrobiia bacterium]